MPENKPGLGRIVDTPRLYPSACLITGRGDGPLIDLLKDFTPDHTGRMYIRVQAVRDMAVQCGMKTPADYEALETRIADLEADIDEITEQRDAAVAALEAVGTLENTGFVVRQKAVGDVAASAA